MPLLLKSLLVLKTIKNHHVFILDYLGLVKREVTYSVRRGGYKIRARGGTDDCKEIVVVLSGYEYDLNLLPRLENPVIFDVGAHIGSFTLYSLNYFEYTKPSIFAFEPDSENFQYLRWNLKENHIQPSLYSLFNCAIGNINGYGILDKSEDTDSYTLCRAPAGRYETCSVRTLKAIIDFLGIDKIDVLKMDIEGGEYAILQDHISFQIITSSVRYILMEYHYLDNVRDKKWIIEKLKSHFDVLFERKQVMYCKNKKMNS